MAVMKEWACLAHGGFDSTLPECPHGCRGAAMVERVFRTPVSVQSAGFRSINQSVETLARDAGVTNIDQRGGDGMLRTDWKARKRMAEATEMMGHGDLAGTNLGQFFASPGSIGAYRGNLGGGTIKKTETRTVTDSHGKQHTYGTGQTVIGDGTVLGLPKTKVAGVFDGSGLGLPAGDA